jgi:isoquinoline 1-oxidoreductase beta subunit
MHPHSSALSLNRRQTLAAAAGAGLLYGFSIPFSGRAARAAGQTAVGAFVRIGADEKITILVGVAEMGQGVSTGVAQVLAEELMVDWSQVTVEMAPASAAYNNPSIRQQATFGSLSMRGFFAPMRKAGATVREMLKIAAANALGVPVAALTAANGRVFVTGTTTSLSYGALAQAASQVQAPASPPLLGTGRYIGVSVPRADIPVKVTGKAVFGTDVALAGMLYASVKHCPVVGGTLPTGYVPPTPRGAIAAVPLGNAIGVVARDTYSAIRAARGVSAPWIIPWGNDQISSASIMSEAQQLMVTGQVLSAEKVGWAEGAFPAANRQLDVMYSVPYLAHACMEVLSCTALVTADHCTLWASTQAQTSCVNTAVAVTGLPASAVTVNTTYLGGGLGRKVDQDFIRQAVTIAKAIPGTPIKLIWSREEDFGADQYRPMGLARVRAGIDYSGNLSAWWSRLVAPSSSHQRSGNNGIDFLAIVGATGLPYAIENRLVEYVRHPAPVPVGSWRSIGYSINIFVAESAIDELAGLAGADPLVFRQRMLGSNPRALAVLDTAAALAGWSTPPASGRARGLAYCFADNSHVALIVEISRSTTGGMRLHKATCVVDVGLAVNPDGVAAQIEGGIVHGISAALWGQVTFSAGRATVRNFNNYRSVRMRDMPEIKVQLIDGNPASLGGAGEVSVPPVAPALANAWARLTGQRLRSLPLFPPAVSGGSPEEDDDD